MPSGKTIKFWVFEILEFTALVAPVFVVLERFASVLKNIGDTTAYWRIVAVTIAYVTIVTLLVWAPLEYMVLKRRRFITEITQWRPTILVYLVLSTAPYRTISETLADLPVSLVLFSMIIVDIVEKLRLYHLMGPSKSFNMVFKKLFHTMAGQHPTRPMYASSGTNSTAYLYTARPRAHSGPIKILWRRDPRRRSLWKASCFGWIQLRCVGVPLLFLMKNLLVCLTYVYFTFLTQLNIFQRRSMF
uniref:Si:dkey-32m20.1 n=1 Tax=Neogobius melanostomus TaxID=47308 RepID=A0A8C6TKP4_9GOBI